MTAFLFPRLDPIAVDQCLNDLDHLISTATQPLTDDRMPAATGWGAIGGTQIPLARLGELRAEIVDQAATCGFPARGSTAARARFDNLVTRVLADFEPLAGGETDRDDVWAFLATVLLPDVVNWRFSGGSAERFHGGVRNTFQRLWMRGWALDEGQDAGIDRWNLVDELTEDALVQLTERPSIGAGPELSKAIARAWLAVSREVGRSRMEEIMRQAIIEVRIRNEIQMLSALELPAINAELMEIFANCAGLSKQPEPGPTEVDANSFELSIIRPASTLPLPDTGEQTIQLAILTLMADRETWSNGQLKARLADMLPLTEADRGTGARKGEELWENRVNNSLGRARASSLYAKGLVENRGLGLHRITEKGLVLLEERFADTPGASD